MRVHLLFTGWTNSHLPTRSSAGTVLCCCFMLFPLVIVGTMYKLKQIVYCAYSCGQLYVVKVSAQKVAKLHITNLLILIKM